jgi:hypothetical protein
MFAIGLLLSFSFQANACLHLSKMRGIFDKVQGVVGMGYLITFMLLKLLEIDQCDWG